MQSNSKDNSAKTEQERVAERLEAVPAQVPYRAPDFKGGQHLSEQEYNMTLDERLSELGLKLDSVRGEITTDSRATRWIELKKAVATTKSMTNPYAKIGVVLELEKTVRSFTG